jgi:hypothetical protein
VTEVNEEMENAKVTGLLVSLEAESMDEASATLMVPGQEEPVVVTVTMGHARQLGAYFGQFVCLTGVMPPEAESREAESRGAIAEADPLGAALLAWDARVAPGAEEPAEGQRPGRTTALRRYSRTGRVGLLGRPL